MDPRNFSVPSPKTWHNAWPVPNWKMHTSHHLAQGDVGHSHHKGCADLPAVPVALVLGRVFVFGREAPASGTLAAQVLPLTARRSKVPLLAKGSSSLNLPVGCAALSPVLLVAICTQQRVYVGFARGSKRCSRASVFTSVRKSQAMCSS